MERREELTRLLCDLIALPSINPEVEVERAEPPYGESAVAAYVQRYFETLGLPVERQPVFPGRDNVLVTLPGRSAAPPVLVEAHMDTVGVVGMKTPFTPRVDAVAGRIYGRGACDDKASLATLMVVFRELWAARTLLPVSCVLVAAMGEEYRGLGASHLAQSGRRFSAAVVGEPTNLDIVAAHNGLLYFKVIAHGLAAHTSTPQRGVNAISIMKDVIAVIETRVQADFPQRVHRLGAAPQCTISLIQGGYSAHVVPDSCEITIDRRLGPGETWETARDEVITWLRAALPGEAFGRLEFPPPIRHVAGLETSVEHPLVQALYAAAAAVRGAARIVGAPYNTDAGRYAAVGIPAVVFGPGDIAQAHAPVEFVTLEQMTLAVDILKRLLLSAETFAGAGS